MEKYINKNIAFLLIAFVALFTLNSAQAQDFQIEDASVWYQGELKPSLEVTVNYEDGRVLLDKWEDFLQNKKGVDLDRATAGLGKTVMASDWVSFRQITPEPMIFHTEFTQEAEKTVMNIFVDFGNGYFMNPYVHEEEFNKTRMLVAEFMNSFDANAYSSVGN